MELIATLVLAMMAVPGPSGIDLERLVDSSISPPGADGDFFIERVPPVVCGDVVLFNGAGGNDGKTGVYLANQSQVVVIANAGVKVPESDKTFQEAREQVCIDDRVVFLGDDDLTPASDGPSVYAFDQGVIEPILKVGTIIGDNRFTGFGEVDANDTRVALVARLFPSSTTQALVIKPYDSDPFIVADKTTILPGQTESVTIYSRPKLISSDLLFHARTHDNLGIYRWAPGQGISVVVDTATPVPLPGAGNFGLFGRFASLDYGIVFEARHSRGRDLFVATSGRITPLVVAGDLTDDGETLVASFFPSGAGSLLSFTGRTADFGEAIFARTADGRILRLLDAGSTIEGRQVDFIDVGPGADASHVAIWVRAFGDTTDEIIYRARIPQPNVIPTLPRSGLLVLALGLVAVGIYALRRFRHVR